MANKLDKFHSLRTRAQELLSVPDSSSIQHPMAEFWDLLHELDTHRIELELQNDELLNTQIQLQDATQEYIDFYNFSPVGYVTLNGEGLIVKSNLTLAALIGVEKRDLINKPFSDFVLDLDQDVFYLYRRELLNNNQTQSCELRLGSVHGKPVWVKLDGPFKISRKDPGISLSLTEINHLKEIEAVLSKSETSLRAIFDNVLDGIIRLNLYGVIESVNPATECIFGFSSEELSGSNISRIIPMFDWREHERRLESFRNCGDSRIIGIRQELEGLKKDGSCFQMDMGISEINTFQPRCFIITVHDISERRQMETLLRESEDRFHSAFNFAAIGMALVAVDGRFLQVNSSLSHIFGYSEEELLNSNLQMLTRDDDYGRVLSHHLHQLQSDDLPSFQIEVECHHKIAGKMVWALISASLVRSAAGEPLFFIIQIQDITDRKYAEWQLLFLANHDPLTGLLNRVQFHSRLSQALASVRRHETRLALMFLDLDRFKLINDTLGHKIGDQLLQAVSDRLKRSIRPNDILARLGGDEFVILLTDIKLVEDIARIAQKTIDLLTQPFSIEGNDIVVTASIGISVYPDDGETSQILLMNADTAMYLAKERGKNNYQFYMMEMTERSLERMTIERGLRQALTHSGLKLHYQPQIDSKTGRGVSVEALLRWQHPEWGLVFPDRFISVAEETGLIVPIGAWVLRTACTQAKAWQGNGGPFTHVSVNLSPRQFLEPDLFETIKEVLTETRLKPRFLELEITESAIMQDPEKTYRVLLQLHELGVRLSIDDFGTGYSSLTYLRQFPVHSVKIDRSFVLDVPGNKDCATMVRAIIALAHELRLQVTAEGVETEEQLAFLKTQHCDVIQGYLFSRPDTSEHLEADFNIMASKALISRTSA